MTRLIACFPWLVLKKPVVVGEVVLVPFKDESGQVSAPIVDLQPSLEKILSSYTDIQGNPVDNCTVATISTRNPVWDLVFEEDREKVQVASQLVSVAAISKNDYNAQLWCYANTTQFQFFFQRFTEPVDYIAIGVRRRDGSTMDAGYKHGEIKLSVPLQARSRKPVCIDADLVNGMIGALQAGSPTARRIMPALSFFNLANTDSDVVDQEAEAILMASAFEQLFGTDSAYTLGKAAGALLQPYGKMVVDAIMATTRPGIVIDSRYEAAQRQFFAHRKWIEELYSLRNCRVHGIPLQSRTWGWIPLEHLIMAAFVFPLTVKVLLSKDGHYSLTEGDIARCHAIDNILAQNKWWESAGNSSNNTVWQETLFECKKKLSREKVVKEIVELLKEQRDDI